MSLLDDLKRQAEELQNTDDQQASEARQEAFYQENLRPAMRSIMRYLSDLTAQLKLVDPDVRQDYTLPGIGLVKGLKQGGYIVNADSADQTKDIRLRFQCTADNEAVYAIQPKAQADETRSFLDAQTMRYAEWPIRDQTQQIVGINFQLQIRVNVILVFQADPVQGVIRMTTANFTDFGAERRIIRPESVDDQWLDKLGYYLLRKDQGIDNLDINDEHKNLIRQRLEDEKRAREQEMELAMNREQAELNATSLQGKARLFSPKHRC